MTKTTKSSSKFLSLILRHRPQLIGLTLDKKGWAKIDDLLDKATAYGKPMDRATLDDIVANNDKKRFVYDDTKQYIRAAQGHSIAVNLDYQAQIPPMVLYHGSAEKFLARITEKGLIKKNRQHVHLSTDKETALKVGQRHGKPIIFEINAQQMQADGYLFYLSDNGVWLTDTVPYDYMQKIAG